MKHAALALKTVQQQRKIITNLIIVYCCEIRCGYILRLPPICYIISDRTHDWVNNYSTNLLILYLCEKLEPSVRIQEVFVKLNDINTNQCDWIIYFKLKLKVFIKDRMSYIHIVVNNTIMLLIRQ